MAEDNNFFEAPIPGMSMTAELGSRPWQKPPQYNTVEEAVEYYLPKFSNPDTLEQLLDVMELGIPLTTIADAMQAGGVMEGLHTIDVGILVMPVLIEMMAYIAEDADIEYNLGMEDEMDEDTISRSQIALAMKKVRAQLPEMVEEAKEQEMPEEAGMESEMEPQLSGLMARRA